MEACGATDRTTGDGARVDHESKRVNCSRVIMRKLQEERVRDAKYHIIKRFKTAPPGRSDPQEPRSRHLHAFMEADRLVVVEFTM